MLEIDLLFKRWPLSRMDGHIIEFIGKLYYFTAKYVRTRAPDSKFMSFVDEGFWLYIKTIIAKKGTSSKMDGLSMSTNFFSASH